MPNKYKRKTDRGIASKELYKLAADDVKLCNKSLRDAAKTYNLSHSSLYRYIKSQNAYEANETTKPPSVGYRSPVIFLEEEEKLLCDYLLTCSEANFGLSTKETRRMAYKFAVKYNKQCPSWVKNEMAGKVWLRLFMKRHNILSTRLPQATSIARATSFNKINVQLFFKKYTAVLDKYQLKAKDIWNISELGISTVQTPDQVVARPGQNQVSAMISADSGSLVTIALAENAIGNCIPPMFIFARNRYNENFICDGPAGSVGTANGSGWMKEDDFYIFLNHFKNQVRPSKDNFVLLLLNNHSFHTAIKNIEFCKVNGIILLTIPPHCSHKLHPMDRKIFEPVKIAINSNFDSWMRSHPGNVMSIYHIPGIFNTAFEKAVTIENVTAGFRATGLWPLNTEAFDDHDVLSSQVPDLMLPAFSVQESCYIQTTASKNINYCRVADQTPKVYITEEPCNIIMYPRFVLDAGVIDGSHPEQIVVNCSPNVLADTLAIQNKPNID